MVESDTRETEWRFDAVDLRPVMRWLSELPGELEGGEVRVEPSGSTSHVDVYVDTADNRFRRAGYAVRLRRASRAKGAGAEATLKALEPNTSEVALRSRREVSEQLEAADHSLLAQSEGAVGLRISAVAGGKKLRPLFEVRTRRSRFSVQVEGHPPGQVTLDDGVGTRAVRRAVPNRVPAAACTVDEVRDGCSHGWPGAPSGGVRPDRNRAGRADWASRARGPTAPVHSSCRSRAGDAAGR
jgi:CYTH domain